MFRFAASVLSMIWASVASAEIVVTNRVLRAGEILTQSDLELKAIESSGAVNEVGQAVGLEARVTIYPNRPIRADQLGAPTLISRNQTVLITYAASGLRIEVEGRALDRGAIGDTVRVMNLASRRTVSGSVLEDGSILVGGSQ